MVDKGMVFAAAWLCTHVPTAVALGACLGVGATAGEIESKANGFSRGCLECFILQWAWHSWAAVWLAFADFALVVPFALCRDPNVSKLGVQYFKTYQEAVSRQSKNLYRTPLITTCFRPAESDAPTRTPINFR